MHVIRNFTKKSMKQNRKRTLMTVIGVMLSVALMLTVVGIAMSFWKSMAENEKAKTGTFHVCFMDIPGEAADQVTGGDHVKTSGISQVQGYVRLEDPFLDYKPYLILMGMDDSAMDLIAYKLSEGHMPEAEGEIALTEEFIRKEMPDVKLGDTLTLPVSRRMIDATDYEEELHETGITELTLRFFYSEDEYLEPVGEQTLVVSGILKSTSEFVDISCVSGYPGFVFMEQPDKSRKLDVYVTFDQPLYSRDYSRNISYDISSAVGGEAQPDWYEPALNEYTKYIGGASLDNNMMLFGMGGIVVLIVVITSIFVIRNSFYISVTEKEVQLGVLRSIGATRRQMRGILYLEGFYVWVRGVVAGILLGVGVTKGLTVLLEKMLGDDIMDMKMYFYIPWWAYLLIVLLSAGAVFFAVLGPATSAAKLSPIEAIRGNGELKVKSKRIKGSKLIRRMFGVGGTIAEKNLKRSRRQYRSTVISLVVAVTIFIAAASFMDMIETSVLETFTVTDLDLAAYPMFQEDITPEKEEKICMDLSRLPAVDKAFVYHSLSGYVDAAAFGTEEGKASGDKLDISIYTVQDSVFSEYMKECGISGDASKGGILINSRIDYTAGDDAEYRPLDVKAGDSIPIKLGGEMEGKDESEEEVITLDILGEASRNPEGEKDRGMLRLYISDKNPLVPRERTSIRSINYISRDSNELEEQIEKYANDNRFVVNIENFGEMSRQNERTLFIAKFFLYGFVIVISLIGVTNVFNTITTSMEMRSREFAMLRSIGMTNKEFRHMIRLESVLYGLRSLIMGILLGVILSLLLYGRLAPGYKTGYHFPAAPILISILAVAVIVSVTMRYSMAKINKQNIIETIRRRNI